MSLNIHRQPTIIKAAVHRPDTRNAINFEVMDKLEALLDEMETDNNLRLFVLTGTGRSFISGGDLHEFHQIKSADGAKAMTRRMLSILTRIEQLPFWTLAAINGHAYGGGWEIPLFFDFRVASSNARIGFTQGKFYLPPGWGGITKLTQLLGADATHYLLASQKVLSASEALQHGYLQDLFQQADFEKELEKLSSTLILNDRPFIEYVKKSNHGQPGDEIEPFSTFWESDIHMKRVEEFLRRKK